MPSRKHLEVRHCQMGIEGRAVVVDFVERDFSGVFVRAQDVKPLTTRLVRDRCARIDEGDFDELVPGPRLEFELCDDDIARHDVSSPWMRAGSMSHPISFADPHSTRRPSKRARQITS